MNPSRMSRLIYVAALPAAALILMPLFLRRADDSATKPASWYCIYPPDVPLVKNYLAAKGCRVVCPTLGDSSVLCAYEMPLEGGGQGRNEHRPDAANLALSAQQFLTSERAASGNAAADRCTVRVIGIDGRELAVCTDGQVQRG